MLVSQQQQGFCRLRGVSHWAGAAVRGSWDSRGAGGASEVSQALENGWQESCIPHSEQ